MSIKTNVVKLCGAMVRRLPFRPALQAVASEYLNAYNGDNDTRPETNGEYALADSLASTCQTIFDIGANVGEWSLRMARSNPAATIHSFEPSAETFKVLLERTTHLGKRIVLNNCGVGAANGDGILTTYPSASEMGSFHKFEGVFFDRLGESNQEVVRLVALDEYCAGRGITKIDFMKVDVEGHEMEVLKGARRMLQTGSVRYLQFEYNGTWIYSRSQLRDIFTLLTNAPYRVFKLLGPKKFLHVPRYSQALETYQYANYLLVSGDHSLPGSATTRKFHV